MVTMFSTTRCSDPESVPLRLIESVDVFLSDRSSDLVVDVFLRLNLRPYITRAGTDEAIESWMFPAIDLMT